jgi:hypothetical protein
MANKDLSCSGYEECSCCEDRVALIKDNRKLRKLVEEADSIIVNLLTVENYREADRMKNWLTRAESVLGGK